MMNTYPVEPENFLDEAIADPSAPPAVNDDYVCERCANIPWKNLATRSNLDDEIISVIDSRLSLLDEARCRICRLLAQAILTHSIFYNKSFMLRRCDTTMFNILHCRGLFLDCCNSHDTESIISRTHYPHLIVTSLDTQPAQSKLQHVYPDSIDTNRIKSWIAECSTYHGAPCTPSFKTRLKGLKVINCDRRIIEPALPGCRYVALSYVWGQQDTNSELFHDLGPYEMLPKTIEDSINVTQTLGYKYLWVDRYCIDQNGGTHKDIQIRQMGEIYAAAQLTIVAAAGDHSEYGLPGVRPSSRGIATSGEHVGSVHLMVYPGRSAAKQVLYTTWIRRAWYVELFEPWPRTLQEFYLSTRRLVFTDREVMFICSSGLACETHPHQSDRHTGLSVFDSKEYNRFWKGWLRDHNDTSNLERGPNFKAVTVMKILEAYSMREMSFERDALHAISGVLRLFAKDGVHHVWGVPCFSSIRTYATHLCCGHSWLQPCQYKRVVELALIWQHTYPSPRRRDFPSWSPLGWSSSFWWLDIPSGDEADWPYMTMEAIGISIQSEGRRYALSDRSLWTNSRCEEIMTNASPYLEVVGLMATLRLFVSAEHDRWNPTIALTLHDGNHAVFLPRWGALPTDLEQASIFKGMLLLGSSIMDTIVQEICAKVLILRDHGDHYERVGMFELPTKLSSESLRRWDEEQRVWFHDEDSASTYVNSHGTHDTSPDDWREDAIAWRPATEEYVEDRSSPSLCDMHVSERWWWKYFEEETMILG